MSLFSRRNFLSSLCATVGSAPFLRCFGFAQSNEPQFTEVTGPFVLWYDKPAKQWLDALPVGNGSLGAMVYGGGEDSSPEKELIRLNDDTLWSAFPRDGNNPNSKKYLPQVRDAVLVQHDYHLADALCRKMQGAHAESFQPLGNLRLAFTHAGPVTSYRRGLDLDSACAWTSYTVDGTKFTRETFSSYPDQVIAFQARASKAHLLNCMISLDGELQLSSKAVSDNELFLTGKAASHIVYAGHPGSDHPVHRSNVPGEGMYFAVAIHVAVEDGTVTASSAGLKVEGASAFTIWLTSATGYRGFKLMPDTPLNEVIAAAQRKLASVRHTPFTQLRVRQQTDHRRLFRQVSFDLGQADLTIPTDQRRARFATKPDPSLVALYFQYGRYLLICSSRPGSQPSNLQGIWDEKVIPPWGSNLTTNINVEMNYWLAETCNLSSCAEPLFDFIAELSQTGAVIAKEAYGLPGWTAHHNVDIWRHANASGEGVASPKFSNWAMAGPWLCAHLYEHYLFTGDSAFLRTKAWPLMKGSAEFCLAWLIEDGDGHLTTCPSESTENTFFAPDGKSAATSAGCTMDMALIRELFTNCIATAKELGIDEPIVQRMKEAIPQLVPYRIGKYGQLQEWSIDFDEDTPGQRHMSQLYPLYPGAEITPRGRPELAKASRVSLERRLANGGAYTGWSRAWTIAFWSRLLDGEKAWESIAILMQDDTNGVLLDIHPASLDPPYWRNGAIFQIEGNFAATAAIAELLLQSHAGSIDLLPALPTAWPTGKVEGLRARGGMSVELQWRQGRAETCTLRPDFTRTYAIRAPRGQTISAIRLGNQTVPFKGQPDGSVIAEFQARRMYRLSFGPVADANT
jgi:alpha-L-fucosidase 2